MIAPTQDRVANGFVCGTQIDRTTRSGNGRVVDAAGDLLWLFRPLERLASASRANPLRKPDFCLANSDGKTELIIRRTSLFPARFQIVEKAKVIGEIARTGFLRVRYQIDLHGVDSWLLRMPLFNTRFGGMSASGSGIWVSVGPSKTEWNIMIESAESRRPLVAALSFIHAEWWNHS